MKKITFTKTLEINKKLDTRAELILDVMQQWNKEVHFRRENGEAYWPNTRVRIAPKPKAYFFRKLKDIPEGILRRWFTEAEKTDNFNKRFWWRHKQYRGII